MHVSKAGVIRLRGQSGIEVTARNNAKLLGLLGLRRSINEVARDARQSVRNEENDGKEREHEMKLKAICKVSSFSSSRFLPDQNGILSRS